MNPHLFGLDVWSWEVIPALVILFAVLAAAGVVLFWTTLFVVNVVTRLTERFVKKQ